MGRGHTLARSGQAPAVVKHTTLCLTLCDHASRLQITLFFLPNPSLTRVGVMVLLCHEINDIFLESAKMARYMRWEDSFGTLFFVGEGSWVFREGLCWARGGKESMTHAYLRPCMALCPPTHPFQIHAPQPLLLPGL